jgi:hypothetical protein
MGIELGSSTHDVPDWTSTLLQFESVRVHKIMYSWKHSDSMISKLIWWSKLISTYVNANLIHQSKFENATYLK